MTARAPIFAAIRSARGRGFLPAEVVAVDGLLDNLGVAREQAEWVPFAAETIKAFEGCHKVLPDGRVQAYPDPGSGGDPWTIGWGSTGPDIKPGTIWTKAQCEARFLNDLNLFGAGVVEALDGAPTTPRQMAALTSFAYNVGLGALRKSTVLRKHKEGDHEAAANAFAAWNKAAGRVMAGLTRRRAAEAALYRKG